MGTEGVKVKEPKRWLRIVRRSSSHDRATRNERLLVRVGVRTEGHLHEVARIAELAEVARVGDEVLHQRLRGDGGVLHEVLWRHWWAVRSTR